MIVATTNPDEALAMRSKTVILKNGYIQQVDNVVNIYQHPANQYVAQFMNHFNMTFFDAALKNKPDGKLELVSSKGGMSFDVDSNEKLNHYIDREVSVGIRHCQLYVDNENPDGISGKIHEIDLLDGERYAYFKSKLVDLKIPIGSEYNEGDKITLALKENGLVIFDKDTGKTIF